MSSKTAKHFALVAGEQSGDYLGAQLIRALRVLYPEAKFSGVGGPQMEAEGIELVAPLDDITVMGFDGLWSKLGGILRLRSRLRERYSVTQPSVFIGIDAPDFNLKLEAQLRRVGVKTAHYVSPTVWAWREYRLKGIKRACDLMLTLFPFEEKYYQNNNIPVTCVGHPLASESITPFDIEAMRDVLQAQGKLLIALMPGSRRSEVGRLGELFLDFIKVVSQRYPDIVFVIPVANKSVDKQLKAMFGKYDNLPIRFIDGSQARNTLASADLAVLASGTAALEAALVATPMIVVYKLSWYTYLFARLTARVQHVSMPNHLTPEPLVPELLQGNANLDNLLNIAVPYIEDSEVRNRQSKALSTIASSLRRNSGELAALALSKLL
ncbi:MAG: lipid-A-disaccharide synthase [Arenicellaceae bacterium]|nr:lipid-A-disaccharide synthase [Arenicellaceae bacterium]